LGPDAKELRSPRMIKLLKQNGYWQWNFTSHLANHPDK
jgi:hypothetical protein